MAFKVRSCFDSSDKFIRDRWTPTGEKYHAIMWINMYTKICYIRKGLENYWPSFNKFPMRLNWELRCAHIKRNMNVQKLFIRAATKIDSALIYLQNKPKYYRRNYRGVKTFDYKRGHYFEPGFFSTTTRLQTAINFADGNILKIVEVLSGYAIKNYSDSPQQNEVLCNSQSLFKILKFEENGDKIKEFMDSERSVKGKVPKVLVWMKQVQIDNTSEGIIDAQLNSQETRVLCNPK